MTLKTNITQPTAIGFTCKICGGVQTIQCFFEATFPICDSCIKDLKEIIEARKKVVTDPSL